MTRSWPKAKITLELCPSGLDTIASCQQLQECRNEGAEVLSQSKTRTRTSTIFTSLKSDGGFPPLLLPTNEHQRIHPYWRQNLWLIHFFVHSFIISRSQSLHATRRFHLSIENKMSSRTYNPSVSELNKAIAGYLAKDVSDNVQRSRNEIWGADVGLLARMTPCLTLPFPFSGVSRSTLVSPWCSLTP